MTDSVPPIDPRHTALLVMDHQPGIIGRMPDPETAVDERVDPQPGDIVVRKTRVRAFSTTDRHEQLRERGIDTLILAGIATSGVIGNAR